MLSQGKPLISYILQSFSEPHAHPRQFRYRSNTALPVSIRRHGASIYRHDNRDRNQRSCMVPKREDPSSRFSFLLGLDHACRRFGANNSHDLSERI